MLCSISVSYAEVPLRADDLLGYSWPYLLKSRTCTGLRAYSLVSWEEARPWSLVLLSSNTFLQFLIHLFYQFL